MKSKDFNIAFSRICEKAESFINDRTQYLLIFELQKRIIKFTA